MTQLRLQNCIIDVHVILRKISSLENDTAALQADLSELFPASHDAGRVRSLTNDAIIEDDHSPAAVAAIVAFKEAALQNERDLDELDLEHATDRQEQAAKTQTSQFELEDVDQALALLASERAVKQELLADVVARLAANNAVKPSNDLSGDPANAALEQLSDAAPQVDLADVPNAEELRG